MDILTHVIVIYLMIGAALQFSTVSGIRPIGYVVGAFIWPWLICVDGTPDVRPFLRWARGETVLERSEWPPGRFRLTIRRRNGSEYTDSVS